jgi:hypothetical protein
MTILNWGSSVGNQTLDASRVILVPETMDAYLARTGLTLPANLQGLNDYGLGFLFTVDSNGDGAFTLGANGLKISSGSVAFTTSNTDDYLEAIGYPPEILEDGTYRNALNLTTIRMGDGNDRFTIIGDGISQQLNAEVSKEESAGYIFQSNIFAGGGDDTVIALMPFQSVFKGGSNTAYHDSIFDAGTPGSIGITLSDDLTLEELAFGDQIELKGSRFDWDIEFKDGNGDNVVTLDSILNEQDYIATSNNNRIYGFESIKFGDILFNLILARQQDSSAIYAQPDYRLNGAENQAPELNSDIAPGSRLWEAFRFSRTTLEGISGTATNPTDVYTGDASDTPYLVGALRFGSLNTEAGDDIVVIGSADQASLDLGAGSDQLELNGNFSRSNAAGGDDNDNIILNSVSNSSIAGGAGRDIIEVRVATTESVFDGGGNPGDTLLLPASFAAYRLSSSNSGGLVTFTDGDGNSFSGFASIQFSDINLDALEKLSLTGPAAPVAEGSSATYTIALNGDGLARGESVAFSLQLGNGTAQVSADLAALALNSLQAAAGIVLRNVTLDAENGLIQAVASASRAFAAAAPIATLTLPVAVDLLTEPAETFLVTLADFVQSQSLTTTISNVLPVAIRLNGPAAVTEGQTATYAVVLDGVGLAADRSVTFRLDSAAGTATAAADFAALLASSLQKADGITLSGISTAADGTVTVTATNTSGAALMVGATLLTVQLPITTDATVEGEETFGITLASNTAVVSSGVVTTTIQDLVPTPTLALSGQTAVIEGQSANYAIVLGGSGLLAGQSVTLTLDSVSGTATEALDFSALLPAALTAGAGITLSNISTDPVSRAVTLTATNTGTSALAPGSQLLSFSLPVNSDDVAETDETFGLTLASANASVSAGSITTTLQNVGGVINRVTTQGAGSLSPAQWLELHGEHATAPPFTGMAGSEENPITVNTGDADNSVRLEGAIAFATLETDGGNDLVQVIFPEAGDSVSPFVQFGHGAYKSTIRTGTGNDVVNIQSLENSDYVRSSPQDPPSYDRPDYYDSTVDAGSGNDYVYGFLPYKTQFVGGEGIDTIFLHGRFSDWTVKTVDQTGNGLDLSDASSDYSIWDADTSLSDTAIENTVRGFEFAQFNDINLALAEKLTLTPAAAAFPEGGTASYAIALAGNGLQRGQSVAFSLQLGDGSARFAADLAALREASLQGAAGIALQDLSVDAAAGRIRAVASATRAFSPGTPIATVAFPVLADRIKESAETFALSLGGLMEPVLTTTTITDADTASLRLSGTAAVAEGASASYSVSLDGVGLGAGQSVAFVLDTAGSSATEGVDFLCPSVPGFIPAPGISLTTSTGADGAVTVTATNNGASDRSAGEPILSFAASTAADDIVEGAEAIELALTSPSAVIADGSLRTTITDADSPVVRLSGSATGAEGTGSACVVSLDGVGLGTGRSLSFTVDTHSGTATEGVDFTGLAFADLKAAAGLKLNRISTDPVTGAITVNATNSTATDLVPGSELLSFVVEAIDDRTSEGHESYGVALTRGTAAVSAGTLNRTIKDDDQAVVRLKGAPGVREGTPARYSVLLDGVGLAAGRSLRLNLDTSGDSATEAADLAALVAADLQAEAGLELGAVSTDPVTGALTFTVTNTSEDDLTARAELLSFTVGTRQDTVAEGPERYAVRLGSGTARVSEPTLITTIADDDAAVIQLTGTTTVQEGGAATYAVSMDQVGLGAGQSLALVLNTASGTASAGVDVATLVPGSLTPGAGIRLSGISTEPGSRAVRLTVTNRSGADLAADAPLLTFALTTTGDRSVESDESYRVTLASSTARVSAAAVTTTITDDDVAPPPPSGGDGGSSDGGDTGRPAGGSMGNPFLNGGKPDDILDQVFGRGRAGFRRKTADPILDSRQRNGQAAARRRVDGPAQNIAGTETPAGMRPELAAVLAAPGFRPDALPGLDSERGATAWSHGMDALPPL